MNLTQSWHVALALAVGTIGGFVFWKLGLPLPWMLGALFPNMILSVAGVPVAGPGILRKYIVAVIGVMLGSRFSPDVMSQIGLWSGSILMLFAYLTCVGLVVVPFYRYVAKFDWTTAYFAGMPGGLAEMVEIGTAKGAKLEPIILAHSLRIVVTITLIAFWFRVLQGHSLGPVSGGGSGILSLKEAALLTASAVAGCILGVKLRIPAPTFLGPMAVSAALHLSGISEAAPPSILVNAVQVVLGTILGAKFFGIAPKELGRALILSIGATVATLALAIGFALLMGISLETEFEQAILALAPGGLTEMGLMALAIEADVAFVALHHVVRILIIIALGPLAYEIFGRIQRRRKLQK